MARPRPEKRDGGHVMASLEIRTAEELSDPAFEARWAARRAARETDVLRGILLTFVERGGPIHVEEIVSAFPDRPSVLDASAAGRSTSKRSLAPSPTARASLTRLRRSTPMT